MASVCLQAFAQGLGRFNGRRFDRNIHVDLRHSGIAGRRSIGGACHLCRSVPPVPNPRPPGSRRAHRQAATRPPRNPEQLTTNNHKFGCPTLAKLGWVGADRSHKSRELEQTAVILRAAEDLLLSCLFSSVFSVIRFPTKILLRKMGRKLVSSPHGPHLSPKCLSINHLQKKINDRSTTRHLLY
jgi:hypothetical protein